MDRPEGEIPPAPQSPGHRRNTPVAGVFLRYDGDTLTVDAEPEPGLTARTSVRVDGIDTPEIRGGCPAEKALALQARDFLISFRRISDF